MASKGIKARVAFTGETLVDKMFHQYRDFSAKHGRDLQLGENMALGVGFYFADTQEEAIRRIRDSHDERFKWFAPFGFVRYTDEEGRPWGTPGAPTELPNIEDGVAQKAWICGPARELRELPARDTGEVPRPGADPGPVARGYPLARVQGAVGDILRRGHAPLPPKGASAPTVAA